MLMMYSFLSRTSFSVNEITINPILLRSSAHVDRMRSPIISGSLHRLFHTELSDDAPQVPFHNQPDQRQPVRIGLGEKLLSGSLDRFGIGLHLDLRHRFHGDGDALPGVEILLRRDVKGHQFERQRLARLDQREDDGSTALDHSRAAKAINEQRLVGQRLREKPRKHTHDKQPGTQKSNTASVMAAINPIPP